MADNRTMAQMLQAPIEGYEDAIVVPPINANNFELKQPLINLVQSNKFTGRQDPHNHLRFFNKVFRGEEIDEEYERICQITIRKLKQDFNIWGSEVRKKEQAYEEEKYSAACRYMLFITCDDEDDYIPSGDIICTSILKLDEVIKSSVENLVPIPSEFEGISDDTCDVPNCDDNRVHVESELVESLINRDTSIVHSSKIDPIFEEFADALAH
ncbi:hypothetical protein Tco_0324873 [Tanacetum coccineum]